MERFIDGIVDSMMSKYGVGEPYVQTRDAMMGTMVIRDKRFIKVRTVDSQPIPAVLATSSMGYGNCSPALTKMTASSYQKEIDAARHGRSAEEASAVETLLEAADNHFGFVNDGGHRTVKMMAIGVAVLTSLPYPKLSYVAATKSPIDLLERAITVACMVEGLDRIELTNDERLAAVFFAFASRKAGEIMAGPMDKIRTVHALATDW